MDRDQSFAFGKNHYFSQVLMDFHYNFIDFYIIREYFAIQNLQYEEISKRIYKPKISLFSNSMENIEVMSKFFCSIQKQYNDCQYQAIKEICSLKEGISLLQGPVPIF